MPYVCADYSKYKFVNVCWNSENGIATVTLKRPPVNSLTAEFLRELSSLLLDLEKDETQGLIFTSEFDEKVFSAGLDFKELYRPSIDHAKEFMSLLHSFSFRLSCTAYPTVAVINGHAPAGGCIIPLCCEYRIGLNNFTIGLNELKFGILLPDWLSSLMIHTIGSRNAEQAILSGTLFSSEHALRIGLVDEIAPTKEVALEKATAFLNKAKIVNRSLRLDAKLHLRRPILQEFQKDIENELAKNVSLLMSDKVQQSLDAHIKILKEKRGN
uniref:Enoyl-CoA delta isomerase 1, mitochondrial n=1 Tax=Photinus pyralis TaxID=7054 RepID=A0A1Y1JXU1_PHOPY